MLVPLLCKWWNIPLRPCVVPFPWRRVNRFERADRLHWVNGRFNGLGQFNGLGRLNGRVDGLDWVDRVDGLDWVDGVGGLDQLDGWVDGLDHVEGVDGLD